MTSRRRITKAFDPELLATICTADPEHFAAYGDRVDLSPGRDGHPRFYYYRDNGADVLAVAHLDTVCPQRRCDVMETATGPVVFSPSLDDRLGAYVILELLPTLGVTVDWLLTTDEEVCDSTAAAFVTERDYNWMVSFDRGGTDVVMYQYETDELAKLVEASGAMMGQGSFSDICVLDHLGCAGFNWGVGYRNYHGPRSHAFLSDTFRQVGQFARFYAANAETRFPYNEYGADVYDEECLCGAPMVDGFCPECDGDALARWEEWESA